jgi:hypothetical protein
MNTTRLVFSFVVFVDSEVVSLSDNLIIYVCLMSRISSRPNTNCIGDALKRVV